jgi:hypothetical protein
MPRDVITERIKSLGDRRREKQAFWALKACELTVIEGDFFGSGKAPPPTHRAVFVDHTWRVDEDSPAQAREPVGASER